VSENLEFPEGFIWGAATASYQIEGGVGEDGRGESIWDRFSHTPGAVVNGDTGDVACDHFHRWKEDVALMVELGLGAYRFSVAWPRVVPDGTGPVYQRGLDFYDRLVDALLDNGIEPFPTLYHWDLPQALEDAGGWPARATAEAFAEYAGAVAARLGDRVRRITTLNEPFVSAILGHLTGEHAPGKRSLGDALATGHHLLLGHGLAAQAIRAAAPNADVGIVLNFEPKHPASDDPRDMELAEIKHAHMNRWFLDPLTGRGYPEAGVAAHGWAMAEVRPPDLGDIAQPLDFLGVNYYTRHILRHEKSVAPVNTTASARTNDMGWEIYPAGLAEILNWVWDDYRIGPMFVTENGAAFHDDSDAAPFVDVDRLEYIREHLQAVHAAIRRGAPVEGYFVWSLLDNFEWAWGYTQRFGIVRVDYETMERTIRESGRWYSKVARSGVVGSQ
jgi:beta-glucosidase